MMFTLLPGPAVAVENSDSNDGNIRLQQWVNFR
jgi:hypothetical protein